MTSSAERVQSCLTGVVWGRVTGETAGMRAVRRMAAKALRDARGGREVAADEVEDLVQELFLKVATLRVKKGAAALGREWAAKEAPEFAAYVRTMLKNLAVESNPAWDVQRALRDVVKAAVAEGLPVACGKPASVEQAGRFQRHLVAAACADLKERGAEVEVAKLTAGLMVEYALSVRVAGGDDAADVFSRAEAAGKDPEALADEATTGATVAASFRAEVGLEGEQLFKLRALGFKEMARRLGLALATAHARYVKAERALGDIARRYGADRDAVARAIELLSAT